MRRGPECRPTSRSSSRSTRPSASACCGPATSCRRSRTSWARSPINPNTVLKAYRDLDREGLVEGRRGVGHLRRRGRSPPPARPRDVQLRSGLERWIARAREAGLDDDDMAALFAGHAASPPAIGASHERDLAGAPGLGKRYGSKLGAARLHARRAGRARSPRSSAPTAPARRRCCSSPSASAGRAPATSGARPRRRATPRALAARRVRGPGASRSTAASPSPRRCSSGASSTPGGTTRSPPSAASASTSRSTSTVGRLSGGQRRRSR